MLESSKSYHKFSDRFINLSNHQFTAKEINLLKKDLDYNIKNIEDKSNINLGVDAKICLSIGYVKIQANILIRKV